MPWHETAPGVFYSDEPVVVAGPDEIRLLTDQAAKHPRRRARLCAHADTDDAVHEMLICLHHETYIRPHRHFKPESIHFIEGCCELVLFDEAGTVTQVLPLDSADATSSPLFVRLAKPVFHTLSILSEYVLFHETTRGPFDPADSEFASWAPAEEDKPAVDAYLDALEEQLSEFRARYETWPV